MDLTAFLLARIDEDEAVARAVITANHGERERYANRAGGGPDDAETDFDFEGPVDGPSGWAAIYVGPARVLAECEAKRRIVEAFKDERVRRDIYNKGYDEGRLTTDNDLRNRLASNAHCRGLEIAMQAHALTYADHPDYLEEWKP